MSKKQLAVVLFVLLAVDGALGSSGSGKAGLSVIENVMVGRPSFSPARGESVLLNYSLKESAAVTVQVYDPDHGLVRSLAEGPKQDAGRKTVTWNGRDLDGEIVPDEAYYFVVTAQGQSGRQETYDPTAVSGGEMIDVGSPNVQQDGAITYVLSRAARVRLRVGVENGPLVATPVDWKPRVAGRVVEQWDMRDSSGILDLRNRRDWKVALAAFTLPDPSVIAHGNKQQSYRSYKLGPAKARPTRPGGVRDLPLSRFSEHWAIPRVVDRAMPVQVDISLQERVLPENPCRITDGAVVRVSVPDDVDRRFLESQGCEIMFFVDMKLVAEIEQAYMPCNWPWDLSDVSAGEHVLTVNLASFRDQIGSASRRVLVERQK